MQRWWLSVMVLFGCGRSELGFPDQAAITSAPACRARTATTDKMPRQGTAANVIDGNPTTSFVSSFDDWQFVTIDLGCERSFAGLRRAMSTGNGDFVRASQGETVSFSTDGQTFTRLTNTTSTGWEAAVNYRPHAWHSLPYGWSPWIRPTAPLSVRAVRFEWDGNADALNEVELDVGG